MRQKDDTKNPFEIKNKVWIFIGVMLLTILITRILTGFRDLDLKLFGYELHHFYYGVALLLIINLSILFGEFHKRFYLILSAIGFGLVADEFVFILGGYRNAEYPSTVTHVIYVVLVILTVLGIILYDFIKRIKAEKPFSKKI